MEGKYNLKSTAVKRLMQEAKELNLPTEQYFAQPLEDNLFEWHFTVRGPPDSDFADGLYHGRIILPPEYPMKPPSIILLTPNGRFEVNKKICLSISGHHPESWQPSWSIRTALLAIIGFMPTHGSGAIGALDYTKEERRILALKSQNWVCSICNIPNKTLLLEPTGKNLVANQEAKELASQISFKGTDKTVPPAPSLSPPVFSPVLTQPFPNFNTPTSFVTPLFNASTSQNEDIAVTDPSSNSVENLTNSPISAANAPSGQSINLQTTASLSHDIRHRHVRSTMSNNSDSRPVTVPMNQPFARSRTLLYMMLILSIALITLVFRRLYSMNFFNLM